MTPAIRLATTPDVGGIERLVHAAYAPYVARIGKPPGPMQDDYAARVAAGTAWVLAIPDAIIGLLVLLPQPDHLLLDNVAVDPTRRGAGHGRALLAFAEAQARAREQPELRLYTHALMHENIAMYSRAGWIEYARVAQNGFDRVLMRKSLS